MEQITILTGSIVTGNSGQTLDTTREVCFDGELVGTYKEPGMHKGSPTDTRGTVQTLYRTEDGRLIVHVERWSNWQGEPNTYTVHQVDLADLERDHPFLADVCGFGQPLTLDQALELGADDELEAAWATRAADSE